MKYSLKNQVFNIQNKTVEFTKLKDLTKDEFDTINNQIKIINLHYLIEDSFLIVKGNYEELIDFINKEYQELEESNLETFMNVKFLKANRVEINRRILNYLSSTRTFIDHLLRILKKLNLHERFNDFLRKIYDDNFSYRFYYKLRNYSQHISLPLTWFSVDVSNLKTRKLIFAFDIKHLLSDYDSWSTLKDDFVKFGNNKLDSQTVTIKHQDNLIEIFDFCQEIFESDFQTAQVFLSKLLKEYFDYNELVIVIEENSFTTRTIPISKKY